MKRHLTSSTTDRGTRGPFSPTRTIIRDEALVAYDNREHPKPVQDGSLLTLASVRVWAHTLVLTGKLDLCSAPELEEEIESLCQEGVTSLTLDLRQLDSIDLAGIAVIAFRSRACRRRGHDFAVIPGSRIIHRALLEAGVTDLRTVEPDEITAHRLSAPSPRGPFPGTRIMGTPGMESS